jgi:hypothetical protein
MSQNTGAPITASELLEMERRAKVEISKDQSEHVLRLVAEVRRLQGPGEHIIDFRSGGWTIQHPLSCRPNLFACKVNRAAESQIANAPKLRLGRYRCYLAKNGRFMVGEEQP